MQNAIGIFAGNATGIRIPASVYLHHNCQAHLNATGTKQIVVRCSEAQKIDEKRLSTGDAGKFKGEKGILPEFPKYALKTFMRQTFSLQIFRSSWCIIFSSTMFP